MQELWESALTIDEYVGQMWRKNRKVFTRNRERTVIDSATRERLAGQRLRVLVLTEHYCEDSAQLVPIVWKLIDEVPSVSLRVIRQHEHPDLAARFLTAGPSSHPAIPVFILLDADYREIGALVERPARVTQEMTAEVRRFAHANPDLPGVKRSLATMPDDTRDAVKQHLAAWRDTRHNEWATWLLDDLATIGTEP
jgi:hypothetical protein